MRACAPRRPGPQLQDRAGEPRKSKDIGEVQTAFSAARGQPDCGPQGFLPLDTRPALHPDGRPLQAFSSRPGAPNATSPQGRCYSVSATRLRIADRQACCAAESKSLFSGVWRSLRVSSTGFIETGQNETCFVRPPMKPMRVVCDGRIWLLPGPRVL